MTGTSQVGSKSSPYPCCIKGNWKEISPIFADKRVVIATGFGLTVAWNYALRVCWLDPATILRQTFPWSCIVLVAQICTTCCLKDKPVAFYLLSFQLSNLVVGLLQFRCWSEMNVWGKRLLWSGILAPVGGITIFYSAKKEEPRSSDRPDSLGTEKHEYQPHIEGGERSVDVASNQSALEDATGLLSDKEDADCVVRIRKKIADFIELEKEVSLAKESQKMPAPQSLKQLFNLGIIKLDDLQAFLSSKASVFKVLESKKSDKIKMEEFLKLLDDQEGRPLNGGREAVETSVKELKNRLSVFNEVEKAIDEASEEPPKLDKLICIVKTSDPVLNSCISDLQSYLNGIRTLIFKDCERRILLSSSKEELAKVWEEVKKKKELFGGDLYSLLIKTNQLKDGSLK